MVIKPNIPNHRRSPDIYQKIYIYWYSITENVYSNLCQDIDTKSIIGPARYANPKWRKMAKLDDGGVKYQHNQKNVRIIYYRNSIGPKIHNNSLQKSK